MRAGEPAQLAPRQPGPVAALLQHNTLPSYSCAQGSWGLHEGQGPDAPCATPGGASPPRLASADVSTALINRLASDVARADVVSAWEQVEALRHELRRKDAELQAALEAVEHLQQQQHDHQQQQHSAPSGAGAAAGALQPALLEQQHPPSAGQQLAQFLKEQLAERDAALEAAEGRAVALQAALAARDSEAAGVEVQCRALAARAQEAEAALAGARAQLAKADQERAALLDELVQMRGRCRQGRQGQARRASVGRSVLPAARQVWAACLQPCC